MGFRRFTAFSLVCFAAATFCADVGARVLVAGQTLGQAGAEHVQFAIEAPDATMLLLAPFLILPLISAVLERYADRRSASIHFAVVALALVGLYAAGHFEAQEALLAEKWTAAALAIGLLPFLAFPILLLAVVAGFVIARVRRPAPSPH